MLSDKLYGLRLNIFVLFFNITRHIAAVVELPTTEGTCVALSDVHTFIVSPQGAVLGESLATTITN